MTTGRINQVAIVAGRPAPEGAGAGTSRGKPELLEGRGADRSHDTRSGEVFRAEAAKALRIIHLPPLSCPRSGPPQTWGCAARDAGPPCNIRSSAGGYQPPVTPGGGYGLRLTPECLGILVAIGQPSTDSRRSPQETYGSSGHPRPAAASPQSGRARGGRMGRPPPRSEPTEPKAHAVTNNSTHGRRSSGYGTYRAGPAHGPIFDQAPGGTGDKRPAHGFDFRSAPKGGGTPGSRRLSCRPVEALKRLPRKPNRL